MRHQLRQFLTTLLFIPASFVTIFLLTILFYKCLNQTVLLVMLVLASICAWFLAKKFMIQRASQVLLLIVLPLLVTVLYLGSQNCARCIAEGAAIKQTTINIRNQAELYFNTNNRKSYEGVCHNEDVVELKTRIADSQLTLREKCYGPVLKLFYPDRVVNSYFECNDSAESFAAAAYLPTTDSDTEFWCVDSSDFAGPRSGSLGDALRCQ